ncbi:hypothetical protein ACLOJK_033839 [Asimina triloba]
MYAFVMRPESLPKSYQDFIQKTGPVAEPVYKAVRECCRGGPVDVAALSVYLSKKTGFGSVSLSEYPSVIPCSIIHPDTTSCLAHNAAAASATFRKTFPLYFSLTFVPFVVLRLQKGLRNEKMVEMVLYLGEITSQGKEVNIRCDNDHHGVGREAQLIRLLPNPETIRSAGVEAEHQINYDRLHVLINEMIDQRLRSRETGMPKKNDFLDVLLDYSQEHDPEFNHRQVNSLVAIRAVAFALPFLESPVRTCCLAVKDAVRSTAFLSAFVGIFQFSFWYEGVICLHRKVTTIDHKLVYWLAGGLSALSALLEKKSRRAELALYVLPRAGDSLWYILVNRHLLPNIKNAEVALFCLCMGGIMYYLEHEPDTMAPFLRGLIRRFLASRISNPAPPANRNASYTYLQTLNVMEKPKVQPNHESESQSAAHEKYNLESIPGL